MRGRVRDDERLVRLALYVDEELCRAVEAAAKRERLTVSTYLRIVVASTLKGGKTAAVKVA